MKDAGRIGIRVRGNYDVAAEYEFLDIVYYSGASYIAKKDSIGNVPEDDNEYWHIFARGMSLESVVAGIKGSAEIEYRQGYVNITPKDIGLEKVADMTPEEIRAGLTAEEVENALGYSPSDITITVDSELSQSSENPVQNKAITTRLAELSSEMAEAGDSQKLYTDTKVADLINGAPETLDTLKEVADAIQENETVVEALDAAIGNKVDKVAGKGLSENDFTTEQMNKLDGIQAGAEANVQPDWNVADANSDAFIKNKPSFITSISVKNIIDALGYTPAISDNLLLDPIGLDIDYWKFSNCKVTRGQVDPIGGMNAIKLAPTGGDGAMDSIPSVNKPMKAIGNSYKFSVWLKADSASSIWIVLRISSAGLKTTCELTTEWKEFSVMGTFNTDHALSQVIVGGWNTFTAGHPDIYIYCPKVMLAP